MRPKHILWLGFLALALSWYLLDPEAHRDLAADFATTVDRVVTADVKGHFPAGARQPLPPGFHSNTGPPQGVE